MFVSAQTCPIWVTYNEVDNSKFWLQSKNYLLLPITEEACKSTGQRAISAFVVCYSRFDIEVNSFIEALTEWSLMWT